MLEILIPGRRRRTQRHFDWRNVFFTVLVFGKDDGQQSLIDTLNSIRAQTYKNIELIVSMPGVDSSLREHDFYSFRGIFSEQTLDPKLLLSSADYDHLWRGEYILFVQAGSEFDSNFFLQINDALKSSQCVELIVVDHLVYDKNADDSRRISLPSWDPDLVSEVDCIGTGFIVGREFLTRNRLPERPETIYCWLKHVAQLQRQPRVAHIDKPLMRIPGAMIAPSVGVSVKKKSASLTEAEKQSVGILLSHCGKPHNLSSFVHSLAQSNAFWPEIAIISDGSEDAESIANYTLLECVHGAHVLKNKRGYNHSRSLNNAISDISSDIIIVLNGGVEFTRPEALQQLVLHASRPEIGVVGCHLLSSDGAQCYPGITFVPDPANQINVPLRIIHERDKIGNLLREFARNYMAVGVVQAMRRDVFMSLGGYDEIFLSGEYSDIDFCLRARGVGLRVVSLPLEGVYYRHLDVQKMLDENEVALRHRAANILHKRWSGQLFPDPFVVPEIDVGGARGGQHLPSLSYSEL